MPELSGLKRIAYHEAGHAVVAFVLHRRFTHVSIIPDDTNLGHVRTPKLPPAFQPDSDYSGATRKLCEKEAMVSLGGPIAERVKIGRTMWKGADSDVKHAFDMCIYHCGNDVETNAYLNWLMERTKSVLSFGRQWAAVEALAQELVVRKYIGERLARKIVREAFENWSKQEQQQRG
jgi:hypothetical protein